MPIYWIQPSGKNSMASSSWYFYKNWNSSPRFEPLIHFLPWYILENAACLIDSMFLMRENMNELYYHFRSSYPVLKFYCFWCEVFWRQWDSNWPHSNLPFATINTVCMCSTYVAPLLTKNIDTSIIERNRYHVK